MRSFRFSSRSVAVLFSFLLLIAGCAGQQSQTTAENTAAEKNPFADAIPLAAPYEHVVIADFTTTDQITTDYPNALKTCQDATVATLAKISQYRSVITGKAAGQKGSTLIVKTHVPEMRIVSSAARMWGGAFAGSSNMTLEVTLIDDVTGKQVGSKTLSSSNNSFAASWTYGSSDRSLPSDMGGILATYIKTVVPSTAP